jgi:hypothetical protein
MPRAKVIFPRLTLGMLARVSPALNVDLHHIKICLQLKATLLFRLSSFALMCAYVRAVFILQVTTVVVDRQCIHIRHNFT